MAPMHRGGQEISVQTDVHGLSGVPVPLNPQRLNDMSRTTLPRGTT